ncbi:MAG TPA: cation diffusion facilitator family transporter [Burkholderiales bacterium]|nr:cation diffusion facilitator family transporter [Burkholderiales bacterium]
MSAGHDHAPAQIRHERPLWWAFGLTCTFLVAEIVGAWLTNSLALLSDAAHMATDTLALVIALGAVRLSRRPADARRTFGYARFEAVGAMVNGLLLFAVAGYILWEAARRFVHPPEVGSTGMLVVAVIGLVVNLVGMRLLQAGAGENLNVKGAYLEVWSDMLGSLAVIVAAIVIKLTGWTVVDPVLAVLIGLWVLPRTWTLLREAGHVLLNGVPDGVDLAELRTALAGEAGVTGVHDLHVWSLGSRRASLTAHVVAAEGADPESLRRRLARMLGERFEIEHSTLQVEAEPCDSHPCEPHGHAHAESHSPTLKA